MSTITTLNSGDSGSTSLGVLNTNFSNLNTDKIEADSSDTLTNKTIDVDNNTVSNIETDNLKSTAKSGLDTTVITGTKGSDGELGKFNADGDLVSAGVSVTTTAPSSTSGDTTVPTSEAVYEFLAGAKTHEVFVPVTKGADAVLSVTSTLPFSQLNIGDIAYFVFLVPQNFNTLTSVDLIMYPDATESLQIDVVINFGGAGQALNDSTSTISNTGKLVTASQFTFWNLDTLSGDPFTGLAAGDVVSISVSSDIDLSRVVGIRFRYSS